MAAYAIMRCKKLSGMGSVAASLQHCFRERETPNADQAKTPDNEHLAAASTNEAMGRLRALLPEKRRKDAVLAVEYVMTASPSWWETASPAQQQEFFDRSLKWLADKYGADRIITASIHRDETSPHLSAFVVPLTADGRLSAKEFVGSKAKMTADQSSFAKEVEHLGLQRGIEGSRAKHQRVSQFYGALEQAPKAPIITPDELKPRQFKEGLLGRLGFKTHSETEGGIAERLTAKVSKAVRPLSESAAIVSQATRRAKEVQDTAASLQKRLKPVLEALEPLNRQMQARAVEMFRALTEKLLAEQREQERQKVQSRQRTRGHDRGIEI
jgi:hypothetical protein